MILDIFKKKVNQMKTVYLVRHAKSDWSTPVDTDFERPLNQRGLRDAPFMADNFAKNYNIKPDLIISSSAIRAYSTAIYFATAINYQIEKIIQDDNIYSNGKSSILELISGLESENSVMLFGHNPDISSTVTFLTKERNSGMSTCCIAHIEFQIEKWKDIMKQNGKLISLNFPKMYFNEINDD